MYRRIATVLALLTASLALGLQAHAAEIRMLIGLSLPPYVIQDENRGLEYDIVREALALRGHEMVPIYVPFGRLASEFNRADAAMTMLPSSGLDACFSDTHIAYHDAAITLAARNLRLDSPADLRTLSVRAFQTAAEQLGPAYRAAVSANPAYSETASQETQNTMLFAGRVDVIVADRRIFNWYNRKLYPADGPPMPAVQMHWLFPPLPYTVAFRDRALCQAFNEGLAALRASGRHEAIVTAYDKP